MVRFILLLASLAIVSCGSTSTDPHDLVTHHDEKRKVTCWVWQTTGYNGAISCLPDKAFE